MLKVRHVGRDKKKRPPRTARQARLRKNILSGKFTTRTAAAVAAGYSKTAAVNAAAKEMRLMHEEFPEILDKHGLTNDALVKDYLQPLMNATETKFGIHKGKFKDKREVVAWAPRRDGLEMAFRLRGAFAQEQKQETVGPANITIEIVNVAGTEPPRVKAIDVTPRLEAKSASADPAEAADTAPTQATRSL